MQKLFHLYFQSFLALEATRLLKFELCQINLQLTDRISLKLDFSSSLLLEYGRKIISVGLHFIFNNRLYG